MPKFASDTALGLIAQPTGTEPYFVVKINWGGGVNYYSTRAIQGLNNNIMEISPIRNERRADSMCNVGSVTIKFSDTDGAIKYVIDRISAENVPAGIWLAFNNTSQNDWIELIQGKTIGPIVWNEKDRTCELRIEVIVNSLEVGYSATFDDFDDLTPSAQGVPWPMIFGKCAHVPALLVKKHAQCHLQCTIRLTKTPIYILTPDKSDIYMDGNPTLLCFLNDEIKPELNVIYVDDASQFPKNSTISINIEDVVFTGQFTDNHTFRVSESNVPKYTGITCIGPPTGDIDAKSPNVIWITQDIPLANHHCYFSAQGGKEWYNYCVRQDGNKCFFRFPFRNPSKPFGPVSMVGKSIVAAYGISKCGVRDDIAGDFYLMKDACGFRRKASGSNNFGALIERFNKLVTDSAAWWTCPMDGEVKTWNASDPDVYVASLTPLSEVKAVWGRRRVEVNGKSRTIMSQIPSSYYTVSHAQFTVNGLKATGLIFAKPLSEFANQEWQEEVLVTATGSIGPNPTSIIQWIANNFTDLSVDQNMFGIASSHTSSTPANFALFDKRDALKLMQDIAFQARCSLLLDSGGVGIIFLPVQPNLQASFNDSNLQDPELGFVERKDIRTKFIASYSTNYKDKPFISSSNQRSRRDVETLLRSLLPTETRSRSETNIYVYPNNINLFGLHVREEQAFIFNDYAPVKKFADFWGFRGSNCWRKIAFNAYLEAAILQPWDLVIVSFADSTILNNGFVYGLVDAVTVNPSNFLIRLDLWIPVVAGGLQIDPRFWPGS